MKRLMREHGLGEPVFEGRGSFFKVSFYGPGEQILDLIPRAGVVDLRELGLHGRQIEALRLMVNAGRGLSNKDYRELFGVSNATAYTDLSQLVDLGYVKGVGKGRARQYMATGI